MGKLSQEQVAEIRAKYASGTHQHVLAAQYGVHQVTVSEIVTGKIHKPRRNFEERFWERVSADGDGCWLWTGDTMSGGYGRMVDENGKRDGCHRIAWRLTFGAIPDSKWVLHRCDVRPCCNPRHLFLGDLPANVADMVAKHRQAAHERHPKAKITMAIADEIRRRCKAGESQRQVGKQFGLSQTAVWSIVKGRRWVR